MNFHPIQLNFAGLVNNDVLSDIKLKATTFDVASCRDNDVEDSKDDHKINDSTFSLLSSLDEDDNEDTCDLDGADSPRKHSKDGSIFCHWDILRARCIVFDLIFHAMHGPQYQANALPTDKIYVDPETNTIHFDISYTALVIVVKYLYTGITRRYDYEDMTTARDVMTLAELLHLQSLCIVINGQFINSRRHMKDAQLHMSSDDTLHEWKAMKLNTFDYTKWNKQQNKYFLNIHVLYHYDEQMYLNVTSRQQIRIKQRIFQISKIIFLSVSEYFNAMFGKSMWKESLPSGHRNIIEMKELNADDFDKLQRFLYTFDQRHYYAVDHGKMNDLDFDKRMESKNSELKKKLLNDTINAFHLSIFFGIEDLRQCLLLIIDKYYLCKNTLGPFWNLGFEFELKDMKELCSNYFSQKFGDISTDTEIFYSFTKNMIKSGLSNGKIQVSTSHMIQVLVNWANFHETSIQELLPPNTLFNEANKSFVLSNRRAMNVQHLLRL
eukprot:168084_1